MFWNLEYGRYFAGNSFVTGHRFPVSCFFIRARIAPWIAGLADYQCQTGNLL